MNSNTAHGIDKDKQELMSNGVLVTLEHGGVAWTVTIQNPGQNRWRAESYTYWPLSHEGGLPENNFLVRDPYASALFEYNDVLSVERIAARLGVLV